MTTQTPSLTTLDSATTQEAKTNPQPCGNTTLGSKEGKTLINEHQGFHQVFIYWDERP